MTLNPSPFTGPPSQRPPVPAFLSRLLALLAGALAADRDRHADRFSGPACWRRMVALGSMLAGLAGIPVVSFVAYGLNGGSYFPGMASIFGGFLQIMLILKIASPDIYLDWLIMGAFDVLIGALLLIDPGLASSLSLVAFALCLAASSLSRLMIGVTFHDASAFTWVGASGLVGLFLLSWFLTVVFLTSDGRLDLPMAADLVLRADLTLRGAAIVGFGLSLPRG